MFYFESTFLTDESYVLKTMTMYNLSYAWLVEVLNVSNSFSWKKMIWWVLCKVWR